MLRAPSNQKEHDSSSSSLRFYLGGFWGFLNGSQGMGNHGEEPIEFDIIWSMNEREWKGYPPVIKHGNGQCASYRWCDFQMVSHIFLWIFHYLYGIFKLPPLITGVYMMYGCQPHVAFAQISWRKDPKSCRRNAPWRIGKLIYKYII